MQGQQKQVLFIRVILVQMYNKFRVPGYSSSELYGEKQKLIGFKVSRAHRSKLGSCVTNKIYYIGIPIRVKK